MSKMLNEINEKKQHNVNNIVAVYLKYKANYDRKASAEPLKVNDFVFLLTGVRSSPLNLSSGRTAKNWRKYYPIVNTSFAELGHTGPNAFIGCTRPNDYIGCEFGPLYVTPKSISKRTEKAVLWQKSHRRHGYFWWKLTTAGSQWKWQRTGSTKRPDEPRKNNADINQSLRPRGCRPHNSNAPADERMPYTPVPPTHVTNRKRQLCWLTSENYM